MPYTRGHVLALRRDGAGVVWRADKMHVWVSPVGGCNGPPRHRAEVRVEDRTDIAAMGIGYKYPVVRCQHMLKVEIARLPAASPIGAVPALLLSRVVASIMREAATLVAEHRMMHVRDMRQSMPVLM